MVVKKYKKSRFWAIYSQDGELIAVTVYKKGAEAIVALLQAAEHAFNQEFA
jgi:hypothetical protein